jgi:hypothetical protein
MEVGSYQLNTASALSSVFNGGHRRTSCIPSLKPIDSETFAEKKLALDYVATNTRDLSLGQNSLENHQKALTDRQRTREKINLKL